MGKQNVNSWSKDEGDLYASSCSLSLGAAMPKKTSTARFSRTMSQSFDILADHVVVSSVKDVATQIEIVNMAGEPQAVIPCPQPGTTEPLPSHPAINNVCVAVNRAMMWYPKQVLCLQRSVVTTCLLRSSGVEAQLVMGAQRTPFKAHPWVVPPLPHMLTPTSLLSWRLPSLRSTLSPAFLPPRTVGSHSWPNQECEAPA